MAFEAVLITLLEPPVDMIVANATGITKGTILKGADPNTASASNGAVDSFGGIAYVDKVASDGNTHLAVIKRAIIKVKVSGTVSYGDPGVTDTHANHLKSGKALTAYDISGTRIYGHFLESATTGETALFYLEPCSSNGIN